MAYNPRTLQQSELEFVDKSRSLILGVCDLPCASQAFTTLVRLRKERVLAAKELCSIYYQIQVRHHLFCGESPSVEP